MNTKEAVKWIFDIWHMWENVYGVSGEISLEEGKKMDEVIELLKRGEENGKYKAIIKELKDNYGFLAHRYEGSDSTDYLKYVIPRLEQKYFPKEVDVNET